VLNTEDDDNDPAEIESAKRAAAAAHTTSETMKTQQADSKTAQKYTRALDRVFDSGGVPVSLPDGRLGSSSHMRS
jgi:hypothetical protein